MDAAKHSGKSKDEIRNAIDYSIKWTRAVKNDLAKGKKYNFEKDLIIDCIYRPFIRKKLYFSKELNEMQYQLPAIFRNELRKGNLVICFNGLNTVHWNSFSSKNIVDLNSLYGGAQCLPIYRYTSTGERIENITNWGLEQFVYHYQDKKIKKKDIFYYTYAVLHNPAYREKYELNLKREFPRLPFYKDFWLWANWGKKLMDLHINYEKSKLFALKRVDIKNGKSMKSGKQPKLKVKLKANKELGEIYLDEVTTLTGVPKAAWEYKLGNRSALEWILDQYKEKKPKDPTIAEKFNTYRFADYKKQVINLLKRVCTVSVETMKIIEEMKINQHGFPPSRE